MTIYVSNIENHKNGYDSLHSIDKYLREVNMKYAEQFKQAENAGNVQDMTYKSVSFEKAGDNVIGELVDIQETTFEKTHSTVNKYILKTDNGLFSIILGAIGDGQLAGRVHPGDILSITFVEKKGLSEGRTANIFDIVRIVKDDNNGQETVNTSDVN
jgi:hypothetical protein|tara:strand:- start:1594 stop:2064 length:471 start_codon:yes stop_codon:yes gene_type:complete